MRPVRTTIDLPEDLHGLMTSLAHDRGQTLSQTVAEVLRVALGDRSIDVRTDGATGLPVVRVGRPVTNDDVRSLDDE
jgi:hypothetical protein